MPKFSQLGLLFVHIPKNAGRSIEAALLQDAGSPDGGRRSLLSRMGKGLLNISASAFAEEYLIGTLDHSFAAQHLTYGEMQALGLLEGNDTKNLTSFCVVRNPFDRAISSVFHFRPGGSAARSDPGQFERMLEEWLDTAPADHNQRSHRRPQRDFVLDQRGNVAVSNCLRFEKLAEDFDALLRDCGIEGISLGWRGKSTRLESYRDYFTPRARQMVEREYGADLEEFGYEF